ncbi:unnamed protein product [Brachionus calyciflorus]|nr:unnamed protein product [Brachionus calyciflorus]
MRIHVKFYNKTMLMNLNEHEMQESVFSLCLEALKRMHEERILTKNITNVHLYKDPHILLYPYDKVFEVLDNNDSVSIILNENVKYHGPTYSMHFNVDETTDFVDTRETLFLNGNDLKICDLVRLGTGKYKIGIADETWQLVRESRQVVDDFVAGKSCIYGINTGFGKFASTVIPSDQLE